ncbi:hypothetical protein L484_020422 [Morus notabilis]|uniref:Pentatricopeptide repeat-containing protein n=1 Tax=Morus notabilis TaxID=981085 RepID=W9SJB3_9ROSA|nr:hypothetical protein L484_020422 [Morus notabilis]
MKRAWKVSELARAEIRHGCSSNPRSLTHFLFTLKKSANHGSVRDLNVDADTHSSSSSSFDSSALFSNISRLFTAKSPTTLSETLTEDLAQEVAQLRDALARNLHDSDEVVRVLEENCGPLLRRFAGGSAIVHLLKQLDSRPSLALEDFNYACKVLNWRRKQEDCEFPMTEEEYAKGIALAGKVEKVGLAIELFSEAANKQLRTTSTYNALMTAYMFNGYAHKCESLFWALKRDPNCSPTIATYNILILVFGRLLLLDHMKLTFKEIENLNLSPNLSTYNALITGYIRAWMWDDMERTFQLMKEGPAKPSTSTYLLMLRGFAHSGNLEKMEQMYELVKDYMTQKHNPLIRTMICAYCKSSGKERIKKIEELMRHIPEEDYRPWLNVLLIRVYAEEDWIEAMEKSIDEAFERKTTVQAIGVMRSITTTYFRSKAVDRLATFIKRAESAGWRICRSLYHCLNQNQLHSQFHHSISSSGQKVSYDPLLCLFVT